MPVWQTVITVASALIGGTLGTLLGGWLKRRADREVRVHEWQVSVVEIYGDLMERLSAHYAAMWDLEAARIDGDPDTIATTLAASLLTRNAITKPRAQLDVLAPQLRPHVERAVHAVYAMDTALDPAHRTHQRLTAQRHAANAARNDLSTAMATVMADLGAGLPTGTRPARRQAGQ